MRAWTLGSGSRGNALVIESDGHRLLVDCGFGPRTLAMRLKTIDVAPESIDAVLVTHEHQDHAQGIERAQHKWRWPVHGAAATLAALPEIAARWRQPVDAGTVYMLDAFEIEAIAVPHDAAAPMAYVITARASGARVGVAHDLGKVPSALRERFAHCDALCVEANHDEVMLRDGPYPAMLKSRIRGGRGHLSNEVCGALVADLAHPRLQAVVLLHLSETNNTPAAAERTVGSAARRGGFTGPVRAAAGRVPMEAFTLGAIKQVFTRWPPHAAASALASAPAMQLDLGF
ncbi:MAG: MBL fold metallo-hydrolase [Gemmatimonadaceae bacterium]